MARAECLPKARSTGALAVGSAPDPHLLNYTWSPMAEGQLEAGEARTMGHSVERGI